MDSQQKNKAERLIYLHALREAYKAGIVSLATRRADPRALLLPGKEVTWLQYVIAKDLAHRIKKALPDLEEITRLHPPINAIVKNLYETRDTKGAKPERYRTWVKDILDEWRKQGSPEAGPQLVNETLVLIEGKRGQLFLHRVEPQEKTRFIISADLLKIKKSGTRNKDAGMHKMCGE